jgi:hypothetical protein
MSLTEFMRCMTLSEESLGLRNRCFLIKMAYHLLSQKYPRAENVPVLVEILAFIVVVPVVF